MRKFYLLLILLMACFTVSLQAQTNVTMRVDMSLQMNVDTVSVAGSFQAAAGFPSDWAPGDTRLEDADMDNIYDITISLPAGMYEFKYVNGTAWGQDEGVPGTCAMNNNRFMSIGNNDTTLDLVCFGSCAACPANVDTINVTLQVDMSNETVGSVVSVAGAFQGQVPGTTGDWKPGETLMTDGDGDGIYEVTVRIAEGTYQYKFLNGDAWGTDEGIPSACAVSNNREMIVLDNDTIVDVVCFGTCDNMCTPPLPPINVTFRVDMQDEILSVDGVFVAGDAQNPKWQKNLDNMTQSASNPDIYEFTYSLVPAEYQFLFFNGDYLNSTDPNDSDFYKEDADFIMLGCGVDNGNGGSNRTVDVRGRLTDTILPAYKYGTCDITDPGGSSVSIEDELGGLTGVQVYPNPFTGTTTLTFSNEANKSYQIDIINISGQVVKSYGDIKGDTHEISSDGLHSGIYFLTIRNREGEVFTEKLVVK
ncbi:T9SS type A sorting domain-containing protein [bacterium]|nr:T9SS type A sorting domain-containing protein [bacterium]